MHPLIIVLVLAAIFALVYLPGMWVKRILQKYKSPDNLFDGTGATFAAHLLQEVNVVGVKVERTDSEGDHYDPLAKVVRLSPDVYEGKSLTAITVAAHEVGHAIQDAGNDRMFRLRQHLAGYALLFQKLGSFAIVCMPLVALVSRSPMLSGLVLMAGIGGMLAATVVHLVTLPVEWNASFGRALPLLKKGHYIPEQYLPHSRKILRAAAMTYVAASLASLLSLSRWIAILRR